MDNEKDLFENQDNIPENEEVTEEIAEEIIEEAAEDVVNEETADDADTVDEAVNPEGDAEAYDLFSGEEVPEIPEKASLSKSAVAAISVVITLVVCLVAAATWYFACYNPYNANTHGYAMDIATVAKLNGVSIPEIKEQYAIPENIPDDTIMEVAINYAPAEKMAELMYGMTLEDLKSAAKLDNLEITENTLWGDIQLAMLEQSVAEKEDAKEAEEMKEEDASAEEEAPAEEEASAEEEAPAEEAAAEEAAE